MQNSHKTKTVPQVFLRMVISAIAILAVTAFYTGSVQAASYCHYPAQASGDCTGITWPTTWIPVDSRTERSDGTTAGDLYNFVGNLANPGIYYAKNGSYFFVRMRLFYNGTITANSFDASKGTIWAYLKTDNLATNTPNFALAFDIANYPTNNNTHGLEMERYSTGSATWGEITMDDVDGSNSKKYSPPFGSGTAGDIDGEPGGTATFSRAEGFIRTVDNVACTVGTDSVCDAGHDYHTFLDFAVKCSYLTSDADLPNLCTAGGVRILAAAINNKNDHSALGATSTNSDISSGLSLSAAPASSDWTGGSPTLAVVNNVKAYTRNGQVIVGWDTASEVGTVGFNVYRVDPASGKRIRINTAIIPALIESPYENEYYAVDQGAAPGKPLTYLLEEVESNGGTRTYGPYTVTAQEEWKSISPTRLLGGSSHYGRSAKKDLTEKSSGKTATKTQSGKAGKQSMNSSIRRGKAETQNINIGIRKPGLYRLEAADIAEASGLSLQTVGALIATNRFSLSNSGKPVGIMPAGDGNALYFYGQEIESIYTDLNMYTLSQGSATIMPTIYPSPTSAGDISQAFFDYQHIEKDVISAQAWFDDTEGDFWVWDYMVAGDPRLQTKSFELQLQGVAGSARITANLRGLSKTGVANEHHVTISLNGQSLVQGAWDGAETRQLSFDVPAESLLEGNNTIQITAQLQSGVPYSLVGVDSFDIEYERFYEAFSDRLALYGDNSAEVVVNGFSSAPIWVLDLQNQRIPSIVGNTKTGGVAGNAWVSFLPEDPDRPYLAVNDTGTIRPDVITAVESADLKDRRKGADYLVITTNDLRNGAEELAAYRGRKGFRTLVVTTDEIYNEYSWGITTPHAIRDFIQDAVANWQPAPKFVVLAGDGSYDYKNFLGYGDSLVPSLLTKTPWTIGVSDALLVDVKGNDGLQDVAVGRIPVTTDTELSEYVRKIARYEESYGVWKKKVLLVADDPGDAGNFQLDSEDIATVLPSRLVPERLYMQMFTLADARDFLLTRWKEGIGFVNYFGHAGYYRIAPEGLLTKDDVPLLQNNGRLPIVAWMSCHLGQFGTTGIETISEALIKQPDGGAAAVWAPAGAAYNDDSKRLATIFWQRLTVGKESTLGEAVSAALKDYRDEGGAEYILRTYTILGDPAISVKR